MSDDKYDWFEDNDTSMPVSDYIYDIAEWIPKAIFDLEPVKEYIRESKDNLAFTDVKRLMIMRNNLYELRDRINELISLAEHRGLIDKPKYQFIEHIPGFVDGYKPRVFEFNTQSELLDNTTITTKCRQDWKIVLSRDSHSNNAMLMQISPDGQKWWVLGNIINGKDLDIPEIEYPERKPQKLSNRIVNGKEVLY